MGFLLMQKMGWSTGLGLGKNEQGDRHLIINKEINCFYLMPTH